MGAESISCVESISRVESISPEFYFFIFKVLKICFAIFFIIKSKLAKLLITNRNFTALAWFFVPLKIPWIKSYFCEIKILTAATADWLWDLKKLLKVGFIIEKQEVFFCRGLWGDFFEKSGSKRAETPSPPKKRYQYILRWKYIIFDFVPIFYTFLNK